jgi:hypothetical protein
VSTLAHRVVRQHGFVVALVTAAVVLAVLVLQQVLSSLVGELADAARGSSGPILYSGWWEATGHQLVVGYLPFAVGVLLSLWFVAPLAAELRLFHVLTRSLLAAAIGAVLVILVQVGIAVYESFHGPLGNMTGISELQAFGGALNGLIAGVRTFVYWTPIVLLSGVLLWIWLDRHPSKHAVAGMIDEV